MISPPDLDYAMFEARHKGSWHFHVWELFNDSLGFVGNLEITEDVIAYLLELGL